MDTLNYAGFWKRFGAAFIDGLIVGTPFMIIALVNFFNPMHLPAMLTGLLGLLMFPVRIVIPWLYYAWFESSGSQATPGKMLLGIKVTNLDGERISFMNATGRYFGKILSSVTLLIGYIMAAFTERKQALHDIIASTLVVNATE